MIEIKFLFIKNELLFALSSGWQAGGEKATTTGFSLTLFIIAYFSLFYTFCVVHISAFQMD
jgi:hypothetical protein